MDVFRVLFGEHAPIWLLPVVRRLQESTLLRALYISTAGQRGDAINANTLRNDASGFGWAMRLAQAHDTPWMRPRIGSPLIDEANEVAFTCLMLVWLCHQVRPCGCGRAAGVGQAKPHSPLNDIYAYRRLPTLPPPHDACHRPAPTTTAAVPPDLG